MDTRIIYKAVRVRLSDADWYQLMNEPVKIPNLGALFASENLFMGHAVENGCFFTFKGGDCNLTDTDGQPVNKKALQALLQKLRKQTPERLTADDEIEMPVPLEE